MMALVRSFSRRFRRRISGFHRMTSPLPPPNRHLLPLPFRHSHLIRPALTTVPVRRKAVTSSRSKRSKLDVTRSGLNTRVLSTGVAIATDTSQVGCSRCKLPSHSFELLLLREHRRCKCQVHGAPTEASKCTFCNKTFTLPKDLERHFKTDSCRRAPESAPRRSFGCICGRQYPRKDSLLRHCRNAKSSLSGALEQHFLKP